MQYNNAYTIEVYEVNFVVYILMLSRAMNVCVHNVYRYELHHCCTYMKH